MPSEAKREAQEALFIAIRDQAENSGKAALQTAEKIRLLRELAEAYRLAAGGPVPAMAATDGQPADERPRRRVPAR